uniref:Uncharacterized protein n=1 Tax=Micrurus paraensis TaxID=1970185 RepID=A0A2D4KGL2_9SAUR
MLLVSSFCAINRYGSQLAILKHFSNFLDSLKLYYLQSIIWMNLFKKKLAIRIFFPVTLFYLHPEEYWSASAAFLHLLFKALIDLKLHVACTAGERERKSVGQKGGRNSSVLCRRNHNAFESQKRTEGKLNSSHLIGVIYASW